MLAAGLVARAFQMVDATRVDKVILLSPDHFKKARRPFATTRRGFETVYGRLEVHQSDVGVLLQSPDLVEESDLFEDERGIGLILPFIKHYLPRAQVVSIAVSTRPIPAGIARYSTTTTIPTLVTTTTRMAPKNSGIAPDAADDRKPRQIRLRACVTEMFVSHDDRLGLFRGRTVSPARKVSTSSSASP
jgi:hypothetical protein